MIGVYAFNGRTIKTVYSFLLKTTADCIPFPFFAVIPVTPFSAFNRLNIKPLHEVLNVTATKIKT